MSPHVCLLSLIKALLKVLDTQIQKEEVLNVSISFLPICFICFFFILTVLFSAASSEGKLVRLACMTKCLFKLVASLLFYNLFLL